MARVSSIILEDARQIVERLGQSLEPLAGSTLLITGGGGFLLSYILDAVKAFNDRHADNPCRLVCVDIFISGLPERVEHLTGDPNFTFIQHDASRPLEYDGPIDYLIHGASIASPMVYRQKPLETIDVNVNGTRHMLELARAKQVRSMLFMSTSEIYGDPTPDAIPTSEDYRGLVSCTGPRACYDESKRLGETLCTIYHQQFGVPVKAIRPFNVYGPGQRLDDKRIIPDLMTAAVNGEPIVLYSDGKATRSFCYVADFITGMLGVLMLDGGGEGYNVGNDQEVSIRTVADLVSNIANGLPTESAVSEDPEYLTDNPQRRCPNLTKLKTATAYRPQIDLEQGLRRTLESYREIVAAA
ncbi:MAG: NAD-dependent epimerase/dehydratase family protein [Planctomycetes bacterium]|jgi:dTDP-glucose 4,6-dehydratase/UDP-glucuronate decarboxylase|nr:NAD-dependent epimerase/dehydratase family protein [Planctomycetota bacterium]